MSASNAPPLDPDISIMRIKQYIELRQKWDAECPDPIGPQTAAYEAFAGRMGDAMRKHAQRIANGFATEGEELAIEAKQKGNEAFANQDYEGANKHYQTAIRQGLPHDAVCWSNKAAALLKLERWDEAESAAKHGLREHAATHGYHSGSFHFKLYHRIGEAAVGKGNFNQAIDYFNRKLKIVPNNAKLTEVEKSLHSKNQQFQHAIGLFPGTTVSGHGATYGKYWGVSPDYWDVLVRAGAYPWDEHAKDLVVVATGASAAQSAHRLSKDELQAGQKHAGMDLGTIPCAYCSGYARPPSHFPLFCRGCGQEAYCEEICAIQHWEVHKRGCSTQNVSNPATLSVGQHNNILVSKRILKIMLDKSKLIEFACIYALDLSNSHTPWENHLVVLDFEYKPDPNVPLKALGIRKMTWEELQQIHPDTSHSTHDSWKKTDAAAKEGGFAGVVAVVGLAQDGKWKTSVSAEGFPVPKELFGMPVPALPPNWKELLLYLVNNP